MNPGLGLRGRAVIENGRLSEQSGEPLGRERLELDVEIGEAGELLLAIACRRRETEACEAWIGYCASSARHAWFTWDGALELMPADAAIGEPLLAELEETAFAFAEQWLWYDEAPEARPRSSASATPSADGRCAARTSGPSASLSCATQFPATVTATCRSRAVARGPARGLMEPQ